MSEQSQQMKSQIDAMLTGIDRLPSLPTLVNRAISMAYNPDVDIKELAEEVSRDPAITASIIKLSNSAYFNPTRQIRSVQEAIVTLGLNTVKDIIVIAASKGVLQMDMEAYKMEDLALWEHSLLVAELSLRIAKLKKIKTKPDVAFTAGLFHDVGKVILAHFFRKIYRQIVMDMEADPTARFTDLEKKHMGYNHNELGGILLKTWKFPTELVEAALYNYHPERAKINPELCAVVHIANIIALASGVGVDIGGLSESLSAEAIKTLGITDDEMKGLYDHLPELLEQLTDFRTI